MNSVESEPAIDQSRTRPALRGIESAYAAGVTHPLVSAALGVIDPAFDDVSVVNLITRSAPMGAVSASVVEATFYNPNPEFIRSVIPRAWELARPEEYLRLQDDAFAPVLEQGVTSMPAGELSELAALARTVTEAAARDRQGKPLFAGLAGLPWPTGDHLVVWHAAKLLREHRGDGHVAALTVESLTGIEALVVHAAFDGIPPDALRLSRRWELGDWNAALDALRRRGWLTDDPAPVLTDEGRARRRWIEDRTDQLAATAFAPIGDAGVARMIELGQTLTRALGDADLIPAHYRLPSNAG
jgi:hypothetical protein